MVEFDGSNANQSCSVADFNSDTTNQDRAPIRMTHDTQHLTISQEEASRVDEDAKRRLLGTRKLSLVVDLDQTIIHAAVDPTIREWMDDKENPNHDAVTDVRAFQLIDDGPAMRGCWYYIKLRPGLMDFLERVSQIYEMHIYTMGTRQYAQQIANIVDPERKYFGERILSRDESGSMVAKNLERLFPVDTKMVVIIDDRGDVWKWSDNLIRVTPFDFFVGIGDINSSFLPKKQEIQATPKKAIESNANGNATISGTQEVTNGATENGAANTTGPDTSALEQLVAMSGGDDPVVREIQSKDQEEIIHSQLEDKPLLKMQQEQDKKDEAVAAAETAQEPTPATSPTTNGETQATSTTDSSTSSTSTEPALPTPPSSPKPKARHSILHTNDTELVSLETRLAAVHTTFFTAYDRARITQKGGRVAALTGKRKIDIPSTTSDAKPSDLQFVPDIASVMPSMKRRVLAGVVLVFSGVLPLGTNVHEADIAVWAATFGARIVEKVTREVTHVIAARAGTAKVKQANRRGGIKVVTTNWLLECIAQWRRLSENAYLLDGPGAAVDDDEIVHPAAPAYMVSSEDDTGTGIETENEVEQGPERERERKRLKLDLHLLDADADADSGGREGEAEPTSPVVMDRAEKAEIDAELAAFLGSDAESESDAESVVSVRMRSASKRKRPPDDDGEGEYGADETASGSGSGSALRRGVSTAGAEGTRGLQREEERTEEREAEEESDDDDAMDRELMRAMEEGEDEDDA